MSLVDRLAREIAPRVKPDRQQKIVEEAQTSGARGGPAAETGSLLEGASGNQPRHPTPRPVVQPGWRGSCRAVSAETGRACALLAGHTGPHRHGSTTFVRTAEAGQTHFTRRAALDDAATARLFDPRSSTHEAP